MTTEQPVGMGKAGTTYGKRAVVMVSAGIDKAVFTTILQTVGAISIGNYCRTARDRVVAFVEHYAHYSHLTTTAICTFFAVERETKGYQRPTKVETLPKILMVLHGSLSCKGKVIETAEKQNNNSQLTERSM